MQVSEQHFALLRNKTGSHLNGQIACGREGVQCFAKEIFFFIFGFFLMQIGKLLPGTAQFCKYLKIGNRKIAFFQLCNVQAFTSNAVV